MKNLSLKERFHASSRSHSILSLAKHRKQRDLVEAWQADECDLWYRLVPEQYSGATENSTDVVVKTPLVFDGD